MKLTHGVSMFCGGLALVLSSIALYRADARTAPHETPPAAVAPVPSTPIALPTPAAAAQANPAPASTQVNAAPAPATAHATAAPAPAATDHVPAPGEVTVRRLVLARGVENRAPVEPGTTFHTGDERIYAFMEVDNHGVEATPLVVTFVPESGHGAVGQVQLDVPSARHWRTWAFTRGIRRPGLWTAVVRTLDGREVARAPFEVTG